MTIGIRIKKIEKVIAKNTKVYDFEVKDAHHYIFEDGTLSHNSYVPMKEMGGGTGLKYAASTIVYLSKSKEKEGTEIVGNIIKCKAFKSRFTKENSQVETRLFYDERGLDRYYGLLELGEKYGVFERVGNRYKIGESSVYPKSILANPEKYFTGEVMQALDECARKEYSYGSFDVEEEDIELD
jgi:hypothetical protein